MFIANSNNLLPLPYVISCKLSSHSIALKTNSLKEVNSIPKYVYEKYFNDCIVRWKKTASNRTYVEGDKIYFDDSNLVFY